MLRRCRSLLTSLSIFWLTGLVPLSVWAQVPHDMAYQGVLTDAVGAPLAGPVALVFRVFDMPAGGTPLYTETHASVPVDEINGSFLVQLGLGSTGLDTNGDGVAETNVYAFDASLFESGPNRYLEIQVGSGVGSEILAPRQMIGAVPYALVAEDVVTDPATSTVGALIADAQAAATNAQATADAAQAAADAAQATARSTTYLQPSPSLGIEAGGLVYDIIDPVTTEYGYGSTFGNSSGAFNETNNLFGPYYNKSGVGGSGCSNQYEHAWDRSWETNYNSSDTANEPWVEENWDIYPPQNTATLSGASGPPPSVGDALTFSGGGTGRVVSISESTLVWRHNLGVTSDAETVSSGGWSASIDSITSQCASAKWRPFLSVYDVLDDTVQYTWTTRAGGDQRDVFQVKNGGIAIGANTSPNGLAGARLLVEGNNAGGATAQAMVVMDYGDDDAGTFNAPRAMDIQMDFSGDNNTINTSMTGLYVDVVNSIGAGTTFGPGSTARGIWITDLHPGGAGNPTGAASNAIEIDAGTPDPIQASLASMHQNIQFTGGNWNNGHLKFGGGQGNHLWFNDTDDVFHISTTTDNGFRPIAEDDGAQILTGRPRTADPCSLKPEAYVFYNTASDYYCFCNGSGEDVQMHSPSTACF